MFFFVDNIALVDESRVEVNRKLELRLWTDSVELKRRIYEI
jgi:hypothetical protein